MQLEDLPPELARIILNYKHEMELLEEWLLVTILMIR